MEYIDTKRCNIKNIEAYIRIFLAVVIVIIVFISEYYFLLLFTLILLYTGIKKHCYIYDLFKKDGKFSMRNYYMSYLPKYNPSAVFMFDKDGKVYFQNQSAKLKFFHINLLKDFDLDIGFDKFKDSESYILYYDYENYHYQLNLQLIKDINSIVIYATDITKIVDLNEEIENTQKEIIYTMAAIGESRSKETGNHVKRVALYSQTLALLYGLSKEEAKILKLASPMHDIGKVAIPDDILNKPAKLTKEEYEIIKNHSRLGFEMLKNSQRPIIKAAAIVAYEHHEKYDGSGYPNGLKAKQIHIFGRITAITDVFDALSSNRVYKKAWELEKVIEFFKEQRAKHFDPELVDLFLSNMDKFLKIKEKYN